jgi:hypothetical protein
VEERTDEIFLIQGKYTVHKLKKFELLNSKIMTTPMMTNMKKLVCLLPIPTRLIRPHRDN